MAELTAEIIRTIVREEIGVSLRPLRQEMTTKFAEIDARFDEARVETASAINQVLETVRSLTDEHRDEEAGIKGRLREHNQRIAKLERLNHLRA